MVGDTTITLQSTTGLPTGTGITLTIDATDPVSGVATPNLEETVTGVVSGSTVTSLLRGKDGTTAQAHASGANVVMWFTANDWNDWQTAYLASHNQAGGIVATSPQVITGINDTNNNQIIGVSPTTSAVNALTAKNSATGNAVQLQATGSDTNIGLTMTSKGSGNITLTAGSSGVVSTNSPTLALNSNPVWQYLGYAQITSNFATSGSSLTAITGLSKTVTIPSGVTQVRVTLYVPSMSVDAAATGNISIWSGTVGSGTQIGSSTNYMAATTIPYPISPAIAIYTPSAGSVTYNAGRSSSTGNPTIDAATSGPAFILVECC